MISFIDTEVNPRTEKVGDYGAVRDDGAVLHTQSRAEFDTFVSTCDFVCGHNIIRHDLRFITLKNNPTIIDTLFLSPLTTAATRLIEAATTHAKMCLS